MSKHYQELMNYMKEIKPISTHSHHLPDSVFIEDFTLQVLLENSYCAWCNVQLGDTFESRAHYFDQIKNRNFFKVMERALQDIYAIDAPLRADTYDVFDDAVRRSHGADSRFHLKILTDVAGFDRMILDAYFKPGDDSGHPEMFSPTFRVDSFFVGYDPDIRDSDGNNCVALYGDRFGDFDTFLSSMREIITTKHRKGAVALKHAKAYDRGLDVDLVKSKRGEYSKKRKRAMTLQILKRSKTICSCRYARLPPS